MKQHQAYYLQQMGYTVWQQRREQIVPKCQCIIARQGLEQVMLLCCLDKTPTKSETDLWVFLAMAFDFSQQYYLVACPSEPIENTVCPSCIEHWLAQSSHHHTIAFGQCHIPSDLGQIKNLLTVPGLAEMINDPRLKKKCFNDIQMFLCQQHLVL